MPNETTPQEPSADGRSRAGRSAPVWRLPHGGPHSDGVGTAAGHPSARAHNCTPGVCTRRKDRRKSVSGKPATDVRRSVRRGLHQTAIHWIPTPRMRGAGHHTTQVQTGGLRPRGVSQNAKPHNRTRDGRSRASRSASVWRLLQGGPPDARTPHTRSTGKRKRADVRTARLGLDATPVRRKISTRA